MNWASWDDYIEAWGNESQGSGYAAHVASPIWTMSLRQAKRLTPYNEAMIKGTKDESSQATKGRYDALRSDDDDDDDNSDGMPDLKDSSSEDEAVTAPPPMPHTTQRQRTSRRRLPTRLTGLQQCCDTCGHADCTATIDKDNSFPNISKPINFKMFGRVHTTAKLNASDEEFTNTQKSRPTQRQRRRRWENRMQEEASSEPNEELRERIVSSSEAQRRKTEQMLDPTMGLGHPLGRGICEVRRKRARKSADAIRRWEDDAKYLTLPSGDCAPASVESKKETSDLSELPKAVSRWDGDSKYQALPTSDFAPVSVEIRKESPDLRTLPAADHQRTVLHPSTPAGLKHGNATCGRYDVTERRQWASKEPSTGCTEGCCWSLKSAGKEGETQKGLSMLMPSGYEKPVEESLDYEEEGELISNMVGTAWESFPFPIIIDSGAAASVLPEKWCSHVQTMSTQASRNGEHYTAANGGEIFDRGDKTITMTSREGHLRNMKFTSCDVNRALGSVSAICNQGHIVVFNAADHSDGIRWGLRETDRRAGQKKEKASKKHGGR